MDKFIAELRSNEALKREFVDFMHAEESKFGESMKVVYDNLNKQVMSSFKAFAAKKGIELKDSEAVQKKYTESCRSIASDLNKFVAQKIVESFK